MINKISVASKMGYKSVRQVDSNTGIMILSKKVGKEYMWEESDVDDYILKSRIEKSKESDVELKEVDDGWGEFEKYLLRYVRHVSKGGYFIVCTDISTNVWVDASENFFNTTPYWEDIDRVYSQYVMLGKTRISLAPDEIKKGVIKPLHLKWKKLREDIISNPKFSISDIVQFSNDIGDIKYNFFDLDGLKMGSHRHWDIWEKQLKPYAIPTWRAFVYSIFCARNRSRQVMWITDDGEKGKTKVMNALSMAGGNHFASSIKIDQISGNKHFGTYFEGFRLINFDDVENVFFLSDSIMKTITGGGQVNVDKKNASSLYSIIPNCRVFVGSNYSPILSGLRAEESRLILIDIQHPSKEDFEYMDGVNNLSEVLCGEVPAYLFDCKKDYDRLCPTDGKIILCDEIVADIQKCQDLTVSITHQFLESFFVFGEGSVEKEVVDRARDHMIRKGVDVKYDKVLHMLKSKGVITKSIEKNGLLLQVYHGIYLNRSWSWDGRILKLIGTDILDKKIDDEL